MRGLESTRENIRVDATEGNWSHSGIVRYFKQYKKLNLNKWENLFLREGGQCFKVLGGGVVFLVFKYMKKRRYRT